MSQFVKLEPEEIDNLHERICKFVDVHIRNSDNPNAHAGAYPPDCTVGRTHFIVPLFGVNTLKKNRESMNILDDMFPGSEIYEERMPDGAEIVYKLNVPITFPKSKRPAYSGGGGSGGGKGGKLTLEYPLMLTMFEIILIGAFYYRYVNGMAF